MDSAIDVVEHEAKRAERPEPEGAFVYQPPSPELRQRFSHIFALTEPLPERPLKLAFDRGTALFLSLATLPLLCLLYLAYLIEGLIVPAHRGPFLISYDAVSRGRVFPKYKVRVVKRADIDGRAAARGEWHGYAAEWSPASRTYVGALVKRLYLGGAS